MPRISATNVRSAGDRRNPPGQVPGSQPQRARWARRVARVLVVLFCLQTVLGSAPAMAQLVAAPGAPAGQRPLIDAAANGVPIVHIAPPSAAGVSRNQFNQFDVGRQGAILNNSGKTVQTQLGGLIGGNLQLGMTPARIVLNEVVSTQPSSLRGTIEIAGQRADIVVANPNGIQCDGCGFLNTAGRATLTTGVPQFGARGALEGFDVTQGQIGVGAAGLNATNLEQLDLVARGLVIEGQVWAQNLQALTGTQKVLYGTLASTPIAGVGSAPVFAVDIKNLGGMYANQIFLVANEKGLGVNSEGRMAALQGNIELSAAGDLRLHDTHAAGDVKLATPGSALLTGTTSARGNASVAAAEQIDNRGSLQPDGNLQLTTPRLVNSGSITQGVADRDLVVSARESIRNTGTIQSRAGLRIDTRALSGAADTAAPGQLLAAGDLTIAATRVDLSNQRIASDRDIAVVADTLGLGESTVRAAGAVALRGTGAVSLGGSQVSADGGVQVSGRSLSMDRTVVQSGRDADVRAREGVVLSGGRVVARDRVSIAAQGIAMDGAEVGATRIALDAGAAALSNRDGRIQASGAEGDALVVKSAGVDNRGGQLRTNGTIVLDSQGGTVDNSGGAVVAGRTDLRNLGTWTNAGGLLATGSDLTLRQQGFDNRGGTVQTAGRLAVDTGGATLDTRGGTLRAGGALLLNGGAGALLGEKATLVAGGDLQIAAGDLGLREATLVAGGALQIGAARADVDGARLSSGRHLRIDSASDATLAGAQLSSAGGLAVQAAGRLLAGGATLVAQDAVDIAARGISLAGSAVGGRSVRLDAGDAPLDNRGGRVVASGTGPRSLVVQARDVDNTDGVLATAGDASVSATSGAIHNVGGTLRAKGELSLEASAIANDRGTIGAGGSLAFSGAELSNRGGTIAAGRDLQIDVGNAQTAGGTLTAARNLSIRAAVLDAAQARIGSGGDLAIAVAGNADLAQAVVASGRDLDAQAASLQAEGARIAADGQAAVRTGTLRGGAWSAQGTLDVSATGMVDVAGGALVAGSVLQVRSNGLDTSAAQVGAGTVVLDAGQGSLRNNQGRIVATQAGRGSLTLRAQGIDNGGGTVSAAGDALVSAGSGAFDNSGGVLQAGGVLQLTASQLRNRGGSVSTGGSLALRSGAFDNAGGTVSAGGDLLVDTNGQTLDNTGGRLMAQGALALQAGAGTIASAGGVITANRDVRIQAGQLDISGGRVSGGQDVDIQVRGPLRAANATLASGNDLTVSAADIRASGAVIDAARALNIRAGGVLDISGTRVAAQGPRAQAVDIRGTAIDARGARIRADADLKLNAAEALDAAGADIAVVGNAELAAGATLTLAGARVVANGANRVSGERIAARGASLSGGNALGIRAASGAADLSAAELQSGGALQVTARGIALDNARVAAVGDVSLEAGAQTLTAGDATVRSRDGAITARAGAIQAASAPPTSPSAAARGFLAATDILLQSGGAIDLSYGTAAAGRNLAVQAHGAVTSRGGLLAARGTATVAGASLDNTGGVVDATRALTLETGGGAVVNNGGRIATRAALAFNPQSGAALAALENRGGAIESAAPLDIRAGRTDNRGGTLSAAGALGLGGGAIDNTGGRIAGTGDVRIDTAGAAFQGADGRIFSQDGAIDLRAGALDLQRADVRARKDIAVGNAGTAGPVAAQGARLVATEGTLNLRLDASSAGFDDAVLQAGGAVGFTAQDSSLRRARIDSGTDVQLSTGTLQAAGLAATAQRALRVDARGAADLQDSVLVAATTASVLATQGLSLDRGRVAAGSVTAHAGAGLLAMAGATVTAAGTDGTATPAVELRGQGMDHRGARTRSSGSLAVDAGTGALDNRGGELLAVGTASLSSQGLDNRAGAIASNGDVVVRANVAPSAGAGAGRLDNRAGSIRSAQGDVRLNAGDVFNDAASGAGGRIAAAGDLSIAAAGVVTNQASSLSAGRDLSIVAGGGLDNRAGSIGAGRHTAIDAASLDNRGGLVGGNGSLQVTARGAGIDNTGGTLQSGQGMALRAAGDIGNAQGKMQSGGGLDVAGRAFDNRAGSVSGQGAVAIGSTSWLGARGQVASGGALSLDTQGGALNMQDGALDAQAGLTLRAGTADISRLQATAAGAVQISAADLAAGDARLQSGASVAVSASGRLAADGLAVSAAQAVSVDAGQASLQRASLAGNTSVSVRADDLGLQAAQIASQGDVGIAGGRSLDLRNASVRAGQDLAVNGGTGSPGGTTQTSGVELMAGRDLTVGLSGAFDLASPDFRYQFGRDLTVRAEGIRTAGTTLSGRNLTLDAGGGLLDNTGGSLTASGVLDARGAGIGNQGGTLAANDSVVVDAGNGALANGSGKIYSVQGAARIAGAAIDNRGGTLSAATDLAVTGRSLDNRGGSAVAANALTVDLGGALDNSGGGRVVANTGNLRLTARGVDNQAGTLSSGAALRLDAGTGTVRNADGTVAATGKVEVAAAALDNQRGSILGTGGLSVGVQGAADNRGGKLGSAQGDTTVDAASLDNSGGQTTGTNVVLGATGGSVRNVAGVVSGSRSVRIAGVGVVNDTGVIEAGAGGIVVDAGAGALSNRDSGSTRGIVTTGDLALRAGSIDNQGGYAGANGNIAVASAADLDNRGGTLLGLGNGAVSAAGTLDNRGGTIATGGALSVDAGQLRNAGAASLVFAGGDLQVTAGSIDNSGTRDGQYRHGLLAGGKLSVTAATIDNQGGAIVALGDADITARTRLDNSAGGQIGGNRVTVDTADLVNTGGRIDGAERVTVRAPRFSADGVIASSGTLALTMDQDYTNTGVVSARGNLEISTTGRYTNQGTVSAEQDLSLKAASLDNRAGASIVSQRTTLNVAGTLTNAGLINSTAGTTAITAGAVDNSGRIYGDSVAVGAGSIANSGSAVIASRAGDLTLTGGVSNTGGAQLLSLGNLAVNGSLRNVGSNVSASGNLGISGRLDNLNAGLVLGTETVGSNAPGAATIMPAGTNDRYPVGDVRYVDDDAGRYVMPSSRYPFGSFGAVPLKLDDDPFKCTPGEGGSCPPQSRFTYADNDPVWDTFKVARPDYSGLTEPTPVPNTNNCSTLEGEDNRAGRYTGGACGGYWNDKDAYDAAHDQRRADASQRLDVALSAFNQDVAGRTFEDVYSMEVTGSSTTRNTVLASAPGRITAGGSISLGDGVNQDSVILAGGALSGGGVQNLATPGQQRITESGRSQLSHVESCGLDKHCRRTDPWTPFTAAPYTTTQNLDVLQALGNTATGGPAAADNPAPPAGQPAVVPRVGVSLGGSRPASGTGSPRANPGTVAPQDGSVRVVAQPLQVDGAVVVTAQSPRTPGVLDVTATPAVAGTQLSTLPLRIDGPGRLTQGGAVDAPLPGSVIAAGARAGQAVAIEQVRSNFAQIAAARPVSQTVVGDTGDSPKAATLAGADAGSPAARGQVKTAGYTTVASGGRLGLPASQLFGAPSRPGAGYLVETDPAFTDERNYLDSDYYLNQLNLDPERSLKRYADGFGEQRLVDDQVMALSGRRFISGYADSQAQYAALMDSGVAYAKEFQLTPGVALSATQMAQLTTDIVWLETQTVRLPDGSSTQALVPRVYLRQPQAGDLQPSGALIAARDITLKTAGDIVNSGSLRAYGGGTGNNAAGDNGTLRITAGNVANSGTMAGGAVTIRAQTDLSNIGGQILGQGAGSTIALSAGRDLVLQTTTQSSSLATAASTSSRTNLDRIATVQGGSIDLQAARDLIAHGATVNATGDAAKQSGTLVASAGRDLVIGTVQERYQLGIANAGGPVVQGRSTGYSEAGSTNVGSAFAARGDMNLQAGRQLDITGSGIAAGGNATLGGADVNIGAATDTRSVSLQAVGKNGYQNAASSAQTAAGSRIGAGNDLRIVANGKAADGQGDIAISGSSLSAGTASGAATGVLALQANRDITIGTAGTASSRQTESYSKSSGLLSTATSRSQTHSDLQGVQGSSLDGKTVSIGAGRDLGVSGSSIVADQNVSLFAGRDIAIAAASQTQTQTASASSSKSGLMSSGMGVTLGSQSQTGHNQGTSTTAVASTVGSIGGNVSIVAGNRVGIVGSGLMTPAGDIAIAGKSVAITEARETASSQSQQTVKQSGLTLSVTAPALAALQSASSTLDASGNTSSSRMQALGMASAAMSVKTAADSLQAAGAAMEAGQSAGEVAKAAGVGVNITLGGSKSESKTSQKSDTARASTLNAGGNIAIVATGAGADSNITLQGVQADAGRDVALKADGDINLLAARNDSEQHSSNKSSSASIGVGVTFGPKLAYGVTAAASSARGQADGADTSYTGTRIAAGNTARIESGGNTTLRGATVAANRVQANVGGDLTIESLQDTSRYDSKQSSAGGSITVGSGVTGSASISSSRVKGDYASVTDQSGFKAGDGGFQVDVGGRTSLKGGAITSSDAAVQSGANRFASAGGTTIEDIQNRDDYKATGASLSGGYGKSEGSTGNLQNFAGGTNGGAAGYGSAKGSQSSTTASAISGIAGDTQARTGDKRSGALAKAWDGKQLEREVQAQVQITATFGQQATKAVGDYASAQYERLKNTDPAEAAKWAEGGAYRVAAHTVIGGLTGGVQGAVGAGTSQAVIDRIGQQIASTDLPPGLKTALVAIAGTSVGAAVGGGAGAAAAGNATVNNYLSHVRPSPIRLSEAERYEAAAAACGKGDAAACDTRNALAQTSAQRDRDLAQACSGATPDACAVRAGEATAMGNTVRTTEGGYVYATSPTLTQLNPSTIGHPKRPDSFHDSLAQSTADGILVEAGNQAIVAVVAPIVKGASAIVGMVKGPVGDLAPSTATTTGIAATDGTAISAYGSGGRAYGSTTVTDASGNVVATQPTVPGAAGREAGAADFGVGANASAPKGSTAAGPSDGISDTIHQGQQGKHVPGDNNFIPGRSTINADIDPQQLLDGVHSGAYPVVGSGSRGQPIVDFGKPIGVDAATGQPTQYGAVHSGKNGAHIVPANPSTIKGAR